MSEERGTHEEDFDPPMHQHLIWEAPGYEQIPNGMWPTPYGGAARSFKKRTDLSSISGNGLTLRQKTSRQSLVQYKTILVGICKTD